jgi:hypothetical protein
VFGMYKKTESFTQNSEDKSYTQNSEDKKGVTR